jgi:hypothetical protein
VDFQNSLWMLIFPKIMIVDVDIDIEQGLVSCWPGRQGRNQSVLGNRKLLWSALV